MKFVDIDHKTIQSSRQNHPELIVRDCQLAFRLNKEQVETLRLILLNRGVNKWFLARRRFIELKHRMKKYVNNPSKKDFLKVYMSMQNICKMSRWVKWGTHAHKDMKQNESDIQIIGRQPRIMLTEGQQQ